MVMNNKLIIGLAALGAAALYYLKGKKEAIEKLTFTPLDININTQKTSLLNLVFNFKIKIGNPSNFNVMLNEVNFDVIINNKKISNFKKTNLTTISANDTKVINLEISIMNLAVIDAVLNAISNGGSIKVELDGFIKTDLGTADINYNKTINV